MHNVCHAGAIGVSLHLLLQEYDRMEKWELQTKALCFQSPESLIADAAAQSAPNANPGDEPCLLRMCPFTLPQSGRPKNKDRRKSTYEKLMGQRRRKRKNTFRSDGKRVDKNPKKRLTPDRSESDPPG